jgi:hypothetical protein
MPKKKYEQKAMTKKSSGVKLKSYAKVYKKKKKPVVKLKTSTEVSGKKLFIRSPKQIRERVATQKAVKEFEAIKGVVSKNPEQGSFKSPDDQTKPVVHLEAMVKEGVRKAHHKAKYGDIKTATVKKKKKY